MGTGAKIIRRSHRRFSGRQSIVLFLLLACQGYGVLTDSSHDTGFLLATPIGIGLPQPEQWQATPAEAVKKVKKSGTAQSRLTQRGKASWYGPGFHGKPTASGEVFDQGLMTAAHNTFPLGSKAKVTNLANGNSVEVKINDRGPHTDGRIIDLSRAAARALGFLESGIAQVRVEVLSVSAG